MFRELGLGPDARPLPRTPIAHDGWQPESPFHQFKHRGLARAQFPWTPIRQQPLGPRLRTDYPT